MHNLNGRKWLEDSYCIVMLYGCHRPRSVEILRDGEGVEWASEPLCICYVFYIDGKHISPAQTIEHSKIANISRATVRREARFTGTMQSRLNYEQAFEEEYGVSFVDVRMTGIVEDMPSLSYWLPTLRRRIYATTESGR